jgi:hypothetical protein
MIAYRHWLILCGVVAVGFPPLTGCARQEEGDVDEVNLTPSKKKKEDYRSLLDTPPAVKGKLTSDLDVPIESRTFNEALMAETRKHEEQQKKRAAQSRSSTPTLPAEALDMPESSSALSSHAAEELDRMSLSSFSRIPDDLGLAKMSASTRSQPVASRAPQETIVPVSQIMMRSLAEVNKLLGAPREKSVGEQYGSSDVVCYYRVSADMEPVRVLFQDGKISTSVTVTFRQPITQEHALRRAGMSSLKRKPQTKADDNLVWDGGFAWKEGRLTLEAAEDQRGKFWSVLAEALTKTPRKSKVKVDESWGVGPQ